jgi:hypothetical protein
MNQCGPAIYVKNVQERRELVLNEKKAVTEICIYEFLHEVHIISPTNALFKSSITKACRNYPNIFRCINAIFRGKNLEEFVVIFFSYYFCYKTSNYEQKPKL